MYIPIINITVPRSYDIPFDFLAPIITMHGPYATKGRYLGQLQIVNEFFEQRCLR